MMNPMQMMNMIMSAQNPKSMFQSMLQQNPQMQQALTSIQNSTQGANPKDIAMQLARQRGVSEEQLMQMYNTLNR